MNYEFTAGVVSHYLECEHQAVGSYTGRGSFAAENHAVSTVVGT